MFLLCLTQAVVRSCNIQTIQIGQKKRKQTRFFKSAAEKRLIHPLDIENLVATDISRRPIKRIINWLSTDIKHNQTELL